MQPPSMIRQTVCPSDITFRSGAYFLSPFPMQSRPYFAHIVPFGFFKVFSRLVSAKFISDPIFSPLVLSAYFTYTECLLIKWCAMI